MAQASESSKAALVIARPIPHVAMSQLHGNRAERDDYPEMSRNPRAGNFLSDSVAALLSSSLFATAFYPLHRIKILLQTQDSNPLVKSGQVKPYRVLTAVPRLLREGGVRELWRGNAAYMARHVPSTTLSFAFKDALLRALPQYDSRQQLGAAAAVNLAAGFLGGAAALFFVYPLDFATIRMAAELRQSKKRLGVVDTLSSVQRHGGLAALYRGFGVSAAAIGAYKALYFGLYDTACAAMESRSNWAAAHAKERLSTSAISAAEGGGRRTWAAVPGSGTSGPPPAAAVAADGHPLQHLQQQQQPRPHYHQHQQQHSGPTIMQRWAAANLVVITASSLTYPLDVVRKRLVADTAHGPHVQQYRGFVDCVAKIARTEGMAGFYRFYGYDMLLRLGGGVLLVLYDEIKTRGPASVTRQLLSQLPQSGQGKSSNSSS